jgi:RHS repeat-associated protein
VTRTTWAGGGISGRVDRTYDDDLRLRTISVNGANAITYAYDADSLLRQAGSLVLNRDPSTGLLAGATLGNVTTSYGYNGFGELASMSASFEATPLYSETYTRDALGRIVTRVETIQGVTTTYEYGYDAAGRLESVTKNGALASQYTYDANGNRLSKQTPTTFETGSYDAQDRMLTYGGATFSYTANGETLTKTDATGTTTYQYDVFGNLLGVDLPNGTQVRYKVDGRNRRIERSVNGVVTQKWLWQGQVSPIAELSASNAVVSRFVYATRVNVPDYVIKSGATYRVVTDHLGSPRLVVNTATGAIAQRMDLDEWGLVTADTNPGYQPFGFAGGVSDSMSGLIRFGFRDLATGPGAWTAGDPVGFEGGNRNLRGYSGAEPINRADASGLGERCTRPLAGAGGALSAVYPHQGFSKGRDARNTEPLHEHLWLDDGRNAGFFDDNEVRGDDGHARDEYSCSGRLLDDETLWEAIEENREDPGKYWLWGPGQNNCQDWVEEVMRDYERIRSEKARRTGEDPEQAYVLDRLFDDP